MSNFRLHDVTKKLTQVSPTDRLLVSDSDHSDNPNTYIEAQNANFVPVGGDAGDLLVKKTIDVVTVGEFGRGSYYYSWGTPDSLKPHNYVSIGSLSQLSSSWTQLNTIPLLPSLNYYFSVSGTISGVQESRSVMVPFASISTSAMAVRFEGTSSAVYFRRVGSNIQARRVGTVSDVKVWGWIAARGGGVRGSKGEKGHYGIRGLPGHPGAPGLPGDRGDDGEEGDEGNKPPRGDPGPPGLRGAVGDSRLVAWADVSATRSGNHQASNYQWTLLDSYGFSSNVRTYTTPIRVRLPFSTTRPNSSYAVIAGSHMEQYVGGSSNRRYYLPNVYAKYTTSVHIGVMEIQDKSFYKWINNPYNFYVLVMDY